MKILIWGEIKNGGPYDIFRRLDYNKVYLELINNYHANCFNVGNKVWIQGIISELSTQENELYFYNPEETWEIINNKYDKIVYSAANMLCKMYVDLIEEVAGIFKNSKIPVYVIAIGTQADKYEDLNSLVNDTSESVIKFVDSIYSTGGEIACRGYFTKEYLDAITKNTAVVTGCPALFQNGRSLQIKKGDGTIKPVFNGNAPFEELANQFEESLYIDQDKYLGLTYDLRQYNMRRYIANCYGCFGYKAMIDYLDGKIKVFYDVPEWKRFLEQNDFNFSMGSRIHGNIMSILSGIPAIVYSVDSRTREMAEFYNIPTINTIEEYYNAKSIYDSLDYDTFNKEYPKLFDNYNAFLKKCGLVEEINQNNIFWERKNPLNSEAIVKKKDSLGDRIKNASMIERLYYRISCKYPSIAKMKETIQTGTVEKYK